MLAVDHQNEPLGTKRNVALDWLRVLACGAVIIVHVSTWVIYNNPTLKNPDWWVGNIFDAVMRWCVPAFIMLTGALLLPKARDTSVQSFWRQKLPRIIVPAAVWSIFYLLVSLFVTQNIDRVGFVLAALGGEPFFHLWYFYLAILLYFLLPFVQMLLAAISYQTAVALIMASFAISTAAGWPAFQGRYIAFTVFAYVSYLAIGHLVFNSQKLTRAGVTICIGLACLCWLVLCIMSAVLLQTFGSAGWEYMFSFSNGFVAVMSICIVRLVLSVNWRWDVSPLASITLGIYAIHPLWVLALNKIGITGLIFGPAIGIPMTSMLVFVISAITAFGLGRMKLLSVLVN